MPAARSSHQFAFKILADAVERRKLEVVLPLRYVGKLPRLRIEVRCADKIIESEDVRVKESVDAAAKRLFYRIAPHIDAGGKS